MPVYGDIYNRYMLQQGKTKQINTKVDVAAPKLSWIQRNLNSIGGAGGATAGGLTGAAIGTAILPGIGTVAGGLLGGLIGGAGGGAAGEAAKQSAQGNYGKASAGNEIAKQALIQGGLGLAGEGAGAIVGRVGSSLLGKIAPKAAKGVDEAGNLLQRAGKNVGHSSRGVRAGVKVPGSEALGVADAAGVNQFLNQVGVKAGSAAKQLGQLEKVHGGWQSELAGVLSASNRTLAPAELKALKNTLTQRVIDNVPGAVDSPALKQGLDFISRAKDIKGLNAAISKLDTGISYVANPDAATAVAQQVTKSLRSGLREGVSELVPGTSELNGLLSQSHSAQDLLKAAARNPEGVRILGNKLGGEAIQSLASKTGSALETIGNAPGRAAQGLLGAMSNPVVKTAGRAITQSRFHPTTPDAVEAAPDEALLDEPVTDVPAEDTSGGIDVNALVQQALSAPDAKTQKEQLSLIKELLAIREMTAPASKTKPLSAEASKQKANTRSGLKALDQLESEIAKDKNLPLKDSLPGGNLIRAVSGSQGFHAAREEIIDVLARLRTGAAISKDEEIRFKSALPTAFDSPQTVAQKIARYRELFEQIQEQSDSGSPAVDLAGVAH